MNPNKTLVRGMAEPASAKGYLGNPANAILENVVSGLLDIY